MVESTAYFVVAESLANAGKYAGADRVTIARRAGRATGSSSRCPTTVAEAPTPKGGGLTGLRRRVEALDGHARGLQPTGRPDHGLRGAAVRVVIAEDLALLRDGLTRLLRDNGIEVSRPFATATP